MGAIAVVCFIRGKGCGTLSLRQGARLVAVMERDTSMQSRALGIFGLCLCLAGAGAASAQSIFVGPGASPLERQAASELRRYIYAASKDLLEIETTETVQAHATGLVVGTRESLPDVGESWPFGLDRPRSDGYLIHAIAEGDRALIVIAAPRPKGVLNGAYGLLEEWGFGFYLGGDTIPETIPTIADAAKQDLDVERSPVYAVRGSLPWYNFFNSPTAWELADHKAFIDQLAKMRCNFLGFHAYDHEPFAAYEHEGQLVAGQPLLNTSRANWGTHPMKTDEFFAGTGQYFAREYFGAASSFIEDQEEAVAAAKHVLRQALEYAKGRGLQTCLGFELRGDPLNPDTQARFEARLKALLRDYTMLDCVWLWEPEAMGIGSQGEPRPQSLWQGYAQRWADDFADVPHSYRRAEAVRLTLFALHAHQVLQATRPDVRLVMSGWGGDQWLRCTDFYPGMDKILPDDVVFSALDNIRVSPSVSKAYGALSAERKRWPIIWFEFDGDQWGPQPNLRATAGACRDALAKGCQGLLGIHWRTRAVEDAAAYCARFAWDPTLTVDDFLARRARELFGVRDAEDLADYLRRLQSLGYRWVGGAGQAECGRFSWSDGELARQTELAAVAHELRKRVGRPTSITEGLLREVTRLGSEIRTVLPEEVEGIVPSLTDFLGIDMLEQPQTALEDIAAYTGYVLLLDRASSLLGPDSGLDELIADGKVADAVDLIRQSKLAEALHTYAGRIRNKGELGVLATINAKLWADVRQRCGFDEDTLAGLVALPEAYAKRPMLLVLPDRVIVAGVPGGDPGVTLKTRALGARAFEDTALARLGATSFALEFPESAFDAGAVEYGVQVRGPRLTSLEWPPGFPKVTATANLLTPSAAPPAAPQAGPVQPVALRHVVDPERWRVHIEWDARPGETYTVSRDDRPLATVAGGWFEDAAPPSNTTVTYGVLARNIASGETASTELAVAVPELPLPEPPEPIRITSRANRIVLGWNSDVVNAAQYYVLKYNERHEVIEETYVEAEHGQYLQISDQVGPARPYIYTIAAVSPDGRVGPPSKRVGIISSADPLAPLLELSFEDDTFLEGLAQLAHGGIALGGRGWAELPPQPEWDPGHALTLSIWVQMEDLEGMPVLICKGAWQRAGYFLQVFNRQVRFHLAGVDTFDAGRPVAGKWEHIVATYGFGQMRIYVNGELVGRKRVSGRPRPDEGEPLYIGRYSATDDVYFVRGLLDDIRIYDVPLTPQEVLQLYNETLREQAGQ